jgi:asparagine synthase (glutamine-hydrolysing)
MCNILHHRGPDSDGFFHNDDVVLGHRRLSIIDLTTGDQPIYNEDRSIVTVFNGEIYNFKDFKSELVKKGHKFYTHSDTEILVHCYEEYGLDFLSNLNGIFAFALYDSKNKRLVLVRDHFGIKPLHFWHNGNTFVFASEQKAILLHPEFKRSVNYDALHSQINLRFNQGDETLFKGIFRVPPAHFLVFENGRITTRKYFELQLESEKLNNENEILEGIKHHLKNAIKRQLLSDVPIGVYLSGGMDSSSIVAMMHSLKVKEINTFTLGFNEDTDEFPDAEMIARQFNTNHKTTSLSMEPLDQLPKVIWYAEEPKINLLQGYNMSKFVSRSCKVVLGGLGGDELFVGYDIYRFIHFFNFLLKNTPPKLQNAILDPLGSFLFKIQNSTRSFRFDEYRRGLQMMLSVGNLQKFYLILRNCWDYDQEFYKDIYHPQFDYKGIIPVRDYFSALFNSTKGQDPIDAVAFTEMHSKMINDYLLVDDRMSMANSVELRVPFLDKDLVAFLTNIPGELKIKNVETKYLFRKAMQRILPREIINKKKWGFTINPYMQFKKDLKTVAERVLTPEFVESQGIFNYKYIRKILDYPPDARLRWHYNYIWLLIGFAVWQKMYIASDNFKLRKFELEEYFN